LLTGAASGGAGNGNSDQQRNIAMRTLKKAALPAALAVGVFALLPGAASAEAKSAPQKDAHAAGGDVPPTLPSAVRVRIKRGENALDKAGEYVDKDQPDKAVNSLRGARANMYAAWRAAKFGIENAPPPPAEDKAVAQAAQDDETVGTIYADPNTTAVAVLGYQHEVYSASLGLLDDAKGSLRDALSTTMFAALDRRDAAINYIRTVAPPVDPEDKTVAQAAQDDTEVPGFDVLMPGIIVDLDDEQAQGKELLADGALTPGEKRIVRLANAQVAETEATVNTYWPTDVED
jgi:hypothetical protein